MRQPDQHHTYEGQEITLRNINWTTHLDKAWAATWVPKEKPWRARVAYGSTPEQAHDGIIEIIDGELHTTPLK